ncbi:hypothetical protein [Lewinella sp. 4G2]|uniref:hypothetical protein n=1 Tax=Lewinella sp. 4G2 TaxID=1803372 RepID=UPI0008375229|nr:hypothetical protein [Lewinella sp. 4G2]
MAQIWKEKFDFKNHKDFMSSYELGGSEICESRKISFIYFVKVVGETFQFVDIDQVKMMKDYLSLEIFPSTRKYNNGLEHHWHSWQERLPKGIHKKSKKDRIMKALNKLEEFIISDDEL